MSLRLCLALAAVLAASACGNGQASSAPARPSSSPSSSSPTVVATAERYGDAFSAHTNAEAEVSSALSHADADKRPILLDFGADWCPNCQIVEGTLRAESSRSALAGYHVVQVDVGRFDRNMDLARRYYKVDSVGIPALVVLRPDGEKRAQLDGAAFPNDPGIPAGPLMAWLKRNA